MGEICPGNCEGCPKIKELVEDHRNVGMLMNIITKRALNGVVDRNAPIVLEMLRSMGMSGLPYTDPEGGVENLETPEDIARASRATVAEVVDNMDQDREEKEKEAEDLTEGCDGPLKMRATRDGVEVMVGVCMSPQMPEEKATTEQAIVARRQTGQ